MNNQPEKKQIQNIPPPPKDPWGPLEMAKEMLKSENFALLVREALIAIERAGEEDATENEMKTGNAKREFLRSYYSVTNNTGGDLGKLGLSASQRVALAKCTDRNTLIWVAAYLEKKDICP